MDLKDVEYKTELKMIEMKMEQIADTIYFNTYEYKPSEAIDTKKYELSRLLNHYASLGMIKHDMMIELEIRMRKDNK